MRSMKWPVRAAALAALWMLATCNTREGGDEHHNDSLILITASGLRTDRLEEGVAQGRLPHLSRLHQRARRFVQCWTPSTSTLSAHSSLFTGQMPHEHGVRADLLFRLPEVPPTLAEELEKRGRRTAAFVSTSRLAPHVGAARGFDTFSMPPIEELRYRAAGEQAAPQELRRALKATLDQADRWLLKTPTPFFLWVQVDLRATEGTASLDSMIARLAELERHLDEWLGLLEKNLQRSRRAAETVIVLCADHGQALLEDGALGFERSVHPSVAHVPCWVVDPRQAQGMNDPRPRSLAHLGEELRGRFRLPVPASDRDVVVECLEPNLQAGRAPCQGVVVDSAYLWFDGSWHCRPCDALLSGGLIAPSAPLEARAEQVLSRARSLKYAPRVLESEPVEAALTCVWQSTRPAHPEQDAIDRLLARTSDPPGEDRLQDQPVELRTISTWAGQTGDLRLRELLILLWSAEEELGRDPAEWFKDAGIDDATVRRWMREVAERMPERPAVAVLAARLLAAELEIEPRADFVRSAIAAAPWYYPAWRMLASLETTGAQQCLREFQRQAPLSSKAQAELEEAMHFDKRPVPR